MTISFPSFDTPPCETAYGAHETHCVIESYLQEFNESEFRERNVDDKTRLLSCTGLNSTDDAWLTPDEILYSHVLAPEFARRLLGIVELEPSNVDDKTRLLFWTGLNSTAGSTDEAWTLPTPGQMIYPHLIPSVLPRPEFGGINLELLNAVFPDLAENNVGYIEEQVSLLRPKLIASLSSLRVGTIRIPDILKGRKEITVNVDQNTEILPSHVLAICQPIMTEGHHTTLGPDPVAMYPIHALVLALQCTKLPIPPPIIPGPDMDDDSEEPQQVSLPIMTISVPSPETFPLLIHYLYTKDLDHLRQSLFPPLNSDRLCWEGEPDVFYTENWTFIKDIGVIIKYMKSMNGFWKNLIALGVLDQELWYAVEGLWLLMVEALKAALGVLELEIVVLTEGAPRPKPFFFHGNESFEDVDLSF